MTWRGDKYKVGSSVQLSSSSICRDTSTEFFVKSSQEDDDEEVLKWAALQKLLTTVWHKVNWLHWKARPGQSKEANELFWKYEKNRKINSLWLKNKTNQQNIQSSKIFFGLIWVENFYFLIFRLRSQNA